MELSITDHNLTCMDRLVHRRSSHSDRLHRCIRILGAFERHFRR